MSKGNEIKSEQLGISYGAATAQLRKKILFFLIQKLGLNTCFQCGKKILDIDALSIEHKIPWLHSENPKELFFDLDNIAFSHLKCNISTIRPTLKGNVVPHGTITRYKYHKCRCKLCRNANSTYEGERRIKE